MICEQCRTDVEPVKTICPGCGARIGTRAKRGEADWREQVRETVIRHKKKRREQQEKRDDEARQLSIFPEATPEDEADRRARERRAEIRARVEERVLKRHPTPLPEGLFEAGQVRIAGGGTASAAAHKLRREAPHVESAEQQLGAGHEERVRPVRDVELESYDPLGDLAEDREIARTPPLDAERPADFADEDLVGVGLASPGERVLGGLIDAAFVALIQLTLFYLTTHLVAQRLGNLPTSAIVSMAVVGAVLAAGYFLFFWGLSGQTLGKLLTGARVVNSKGGALGFGRAGARLVGALVAGAPFFAGFITIWTDPERRGWHDRIAGTKVVRG